MDIISILLLDKFDEKITELIRPLFETYAEKYHYKYIGIKDINGNKVYEGDLLASEVNEHFYYIILDKGRYIARRLHEEHIELTFLYENIIDLKLHVIQRQYTKLM